jgi:formiminotetrahydrofolate cyclodeaminase
MLVDMKLKEFVESLGAGTPTPGGGSAAALAGGLAAALGGMVCELTLGKAKYESVQAEMQKSRDALSGLKKDLLALVDRDSEAYDEVSKAMKLPKETPDQKGARREALEKASRFATEIPVKTAETCLAVMEQVRQVAKHGNPNAASDAGVAAHLAHAGVSGAVMNVRINLKGIDDPALTGRLDERMGKLEEQAGRLLQETRDIVAARLAR